VGIVGGPIERIDDPGNVLYPILTMMFLCKNGMRGKRFPDPGDDELLCGNIHIGHKIHGAFVQNPKFGAETVDQQLSGFPGNLKSYPFEIINACYGKIIVQCSSGALPPLSGF
jgi:hypothetical protein